MTHHPARWARAGGRGDGHEAAAAARGASARQAAGRQLFCREEVAAGMLAAVQNEE
jgi:hypothetical protein